MWGRWDVAIQQINCRAPSVAKCKHRPPERIFVEHGLAELHQTVNPPAHILAKSGLLFSCPCRKSDGRPSLLATSPDTQQIPSHHLAQPPARVATRCYACANSRLPLHIATTGKIASKAGNNKGISRADDGGQTGGGGIRQMIVSYGRKCGAGSGMPGGNSCRVSAACFTGPRVRRRHCQWDATLYGSCCDRD